MKYMRLPNRQKVAVVGKWSAFQIFKELYEDEPYIKHGLSIEPGDTVIDIGGNIGLWSMFVLDRIPNIKLLTVEPIPEIYKALEKNLGTYDKGNSRVRTRNIGLASSSGKRVFHFYPRLSSNSTATPVIKEKQINGFVENDRDGILRFLPKAIRHMLVGIAVDWVFKARRIECEMRTLSELIEEHDIERIDFIKLDAENAEREVLGGIKVDDWKKIRQLAIEVHTNVPEGESLVEELTARLMAYGFCVSVDLESRFSHVGVHMMYARKAELASGMN